MEKRQDARIRLAVLLQDLEFGGTQRYAVNLLTHIDRERFDPELWVLRGGTDMLQLADEARIKTVHISEDSSVHVGVLVRLWWRLARRRPDILYTLTVLPNSWGRLLGYLAGIPVIVSSYRNRIARQFDKWLWPMSRKIICNAQSLEETLVNRFSVDPKRVTVIPNGVDTDFFCPGTNGEHKQTTIVSVGRLVPQKDPLTLLEAFRLLSSQLPEARLVMIGNGPLRGDAESFVAENGLESRVTLLPGTSDVRSHLRQARVFALSSLYEGSPNVMIEAMATGLPIVGTRVDGVPELVTDGWSGALVEPGNPAALADALAAMVPDEAKCRQMGFHAREKVLSGHDLKTMVRLTEEVLIECFTQAGNTIPSRS